MKPSVKNLYEFTMICNLTYVASSQALTEVLGVGEINDNITRAMQVARRITL